MTNQEAKTLTRDCIKTALLQLMQTHSFDDITVSSILERSGVSRAGFYRNYASKEKVLEEILQIIYEKIIKLFFDLPGEKNDIKRYSALFQFILDQPESIKKLLEIQKKNPQIFVSNFYMKEKYFNPSRYDRYDQYAIHVFWHGIRDIIQQWIENGMEEPPERMAEFIVRLYRFEHIPIH